MKGLDNFEPDYYYHIVNHAVGNENIFREPDNFRYFLDKYAQHTSSVFDTFAYCLMPNHFHLLVRIKPIDIIQNDERFKGDIHKFIMQKISNLLNGYAKAYNKMYSRKGALFVDYTKRFLIDSDTYFTAALGYIHQNPVSHGFVISPSDWPYSSYHSHLSEKQTRLMRDDVIKWFGNKQAYIAYHQNNQFSLLGDLEF